MSILFYCLFVFSHNENIKKFSLKEHEDNKPKHDKNIGLYKEIEKLEQKIEILETNSQKLYPEVKFLSYEKRKRILVTGGCGFIGSHLVDQLMMEGHEVTVVDNFFSGKRRNIEHWIGHENFDLLKHDVISPLYLEVDQIYHLASPSSHPRFFQNPIKTLKTNTIGTINMLGLAKRVRARLLLASASEIYGDPEKTPQSESLWGRVDPTGARACYKEGKRIAETMCYAYEKQEGVEVRVARIFNTYGPRMEMEDERFMSHFILEALHKMPITIPGNGLESSSFLFVSDLVRGLILLMNSNYSKPVNLGQPSKVTFNHLADLVSHLCGNYSVKIFLPKEKIKLNNQDPDTTLAQSILQWKPNVSLKSGLKETIDYFKEEFKF